MSRKHLTPIGVLAQASDPTGVNVGDIYFNTTIGAYKQYTGSAWVNLVAQPTDGVVGGTIYTGDTTPSSPYIGDIWIDSTGTTVTATSANTINAIVQRDSTGSFSAGGVTVVPPSATSVPVVISLPAGQTANAITINTVDYGNNTVTISSAGNLALNNGGLSAPSATVSGRLLSGGTGGVTSSGPGIFYNTLTSAYNDLGIITAGQAIPFSTYNINRFTTATAFTITATVPPAGTYCSLIIVTSGIITRTITFSTGFKTGTTTLATGTVAGKYFVLNYVSDGTNLIETSRTAAI